LSVQIYFSMKTTTKIALSLLLVTTAMVMTNTMTSEADGNTSAAPASKTGSPGDGGNCTSCHAGTATTVPGLITSNIPVTGYVPGQVYTITGTVSMSGKTKFGFEISPQNATGVKKGTMTVTSSTTTQLISTGKYITHKTAGTAFSSGTATWSFNWTAPPAGTGNLTFYGAFNITNSSNTNSGDIVQLSTLPVTEDLTTGIPELQELNARINVFPNPVIDNITVSNTSDSDGQATVSIINIEGRVVKNIEGMNFNTSINLEDLCKGFYVLRIETEKGTVIKKIVKQ
jgi:hypothetical protein